MNADDRTLPVYYLKPGELHIAAQPGIVTTVLGSCVSVTMFHRKREMGAICHGLMPEWKEKDRSGRQNNDGFKYVDYSIRYMTDQFRSCGITPREIEVKLFGGADMFPPGEGGRKYITIGKQNVRAALLMMEKEGLTVRTRDVGGMQGRKLHFYLHTGDVFLKRLNGAENSRIHKIQSMARRGPSHGIEALEPIGYGDDRCRPRERGAMTHV